MGSRNSRPIVAPSEIHKKLTSKQTESVKQKFIQLSKNNDFVNGRIPKELFINTYLRKRLPKIHPDLLERFFVVLSFHGKDYIIFEEFLQAKYLLDHIPAEPEQQIAKSADDFFTEDEIISNHRLQFIFNLFDLEFNGYLNMKCLQKMLPIMMQDASVRTLEMEELKEYTAWFETISEFAMIQFDRSKQSRIAWRDFRFLARYDLTVANLLEQITPQRVEYPVFDYARTVGKPRKMSKKKQKRSNKHTSSSRTQTAK